jgi:hypothetical protein
LAAATILAVGSATSACTSVDSVRASRESGVVHRFVAPYQTVLAVVPAALEALKMRVAESTDPARGEHVIVGRYTAALLRDGFVRISIRKLNDDQTAVEILSKAGQFAAMPGSVGNSGDLFLEIGKRLYGT